MALTDTDGTIWKRAAQLTRQSRETSSAIFATFTSGIDLMAAAAVVTG
ncbi:hypothetical protein [Streptomyces sp. R08]|uniref:Uncharacterized protein n=1 Tax=Streptomyces sp. R08 TaxID=3238624 RepID=A0AB39MLW6_9ACTN